MVRSAIILNLLYALASSDVSRNTKQFVPCHYPPWYVTRSLGFKKSGLNRRGVSGKRRPHTLADKTTAHFGRHWRPPSPMLLRKQKTLTLQSRAVRICSEMPCMLSTQHRRQRSRRVFPKGKLSWYSHLSCRKQFHQLISMNPSFRRRP